MSEYLLNPMNMRVLESFFFAKTLLAFDFDGTLAPICSDPAKAGMTPRVSDLFRELAKLCPVAIITGRSIEDMKQHLPDEPITIIGNHGCEGLQPPEVLQKIKQDCDSWMRLLDKNYGELERLGVVIEHKTFSLSLHYRTSHSPQIAAALIQYLASKFSNAVVSPGKYVFNVTSYRAWDKGTALDHLLYAKNYHFGVYFGDDITDENVFRLPSNKILSVKIGLEPTRARYYLKHQKEMEGVLSYLVKLFAKTTESTPT